MVTFLVLMICRCSNLIRIVVEDSEVGLQAALAAKMSCVFYNPDSHDISALMHSAPDCIEQISDMTELPDAVDTLADKIAR